MASIANGMAAYNPGTFIPITATFFMFYLYVSILFSLGNLSIVWLTIGISTGSARCTHGSVE